MKNHVSSILLSIVIILLAGLVAFAGDSKAKAPDSLKAELTDQQEIQLSWMGSENAAQFAVYRAEVSKVSEKLDYSKLEFTKVGVVKEAKFTDKILTESEKDQPLPALFVYYVTAIDKAGKEGDKSNYAEVNTSMKAKAEIIN